jgi:hypothetical protein
MFDDGVVAALLLLSRGEKSQAARAKPTAPTTIIKFWREALSALALIASIVSISRAHRWQTVASQATEDRQNGHRFFATLSSSTDPGKQPSRAV